MAADLLAVREGGASGCDHVSLVDLGTGGNTGYYLCEDCAWVLVTRNGRTWAIPPSERL